MGSFQSVSNDNNKLIFLNFLKDFSNKQSINNLWLRFDVDKNGNLDVHELPDFIYSLLVAVWEKYSYDGSLSSSLSSSSSSSSSISEEKYFSEAVNIIHQIWSKYWSVTSNNKISSIELDKLSSYLEKEWSDLIPRVLESQRLSLIQFLSNEQNQEALKDLWEQFDVKRQGKIDRKDLEDLIYSLLVNCYEHSKENIAHSKAPKEAYFAPHIAYIQKCLQPFIDNDKKKEKIITKEEFSKFAQYLEQNSTSSNTKTGSEEKKRFSGKVAIITGSTAGIGKAIAYRLADEGATVIISSRKADSVQKEVQYLTSKGKKAYGMACHQGSASDVAKLIDFVIAKCGRIDFLIPNAAANVHFGAMLSATEKQWDKIFEVNLKGPFLLVQKAYPHLKKTKGSVVLVSSIGAYEAEPMLGIYNVSKTALLGMTYALSRELGRDGIRVNCIAPGLIPTKFSEALVSNKDARNLMVARTSLHRLGTPEDCAGVVAFLCSEDACYITGETIAVAGGSRSRL